MSLTSFLMEAKVYWLNCPPMTSLPPMVEVPIVNAPVRAGDHAASMR